MNTKQFASYVGASEAIVRRWFRSGKLPGVRKDKTVHPAEWVVDDPQAAVKAWREKADHSKSSSAVLARAAATGRAAARVVPPELSNVRDRALSNGFDEVEASLVELRDRLLGALGLELDDSDRSTIAEVFETARAAYEERLGS